MVSQYSIEFCERAVKTLRSLDTRLLGRPLSHPFLVLKDGERVAGEIHGTVSSASSDKRPLGMLAISFTMWAASLGNSYGSVTRAASRLVPSQLPVNRMVVLRGRHSYPSAVRADKIYEGSDHDVIGKWEMTAHLANVVDKFRVPHHKYALAQGSSNCQVTLRSVMHHGGLIPKEGLELTLADAGWSNQTDLIRNALKL